MVLQNDWGCELISCCFLHIQLKWSSLLQKKLHITFIPFYDLKSQLFLKKCLVGKNFTTFIQFDFQSFLWSRFCFFHDFLISLFFKTNISSVRDGAEKESFQTTFFQEVLDSSKSLRRYFPMNIFCFFFVFSRLWSLRERSTAPTWMRFLIFLPVLIVSWVTSFFPTCVLGTRSASLRGSVGKPLVLPTYFTLFSIVCFLDVLIFCNLIVLQLLKNLSPVFLLGKNAEKENSTVVVFYFVLYSAIKNTFSISFIDSVFY